MKVGVLLPAHNDSLGKGYAMFRKMIASMLNLKFSSHEWHWMVNFQHYNNNMCDELSRNMQINLGASHNVYYIQREYPPPIQLAAIREDAALALAEELAIDVDVYVAMDDDFVFRPGCVEDYDSILNHFSEFPRCGTIMAASHFGGHTYGQSIVRKWNQLWWTNRGLFLRNISKQAGWHYCDHDIFGFPGLPEDAYAVFSRIDKGYWAAKRANVRVTHKPGKVDFDFEGCNSRKGRYPVHEDMHNMKLFPQVEEHIRQKWHDPNWYLLCKFLPHDLAQKAVEIDAIEDVEPA